jgi:hypothetical protein
MSPVERVRCYPKQACALGAVFVVATLAVLIVVDDSAVDHFAIWLSGLIEGILLGLVLLGGVEFALIRPGVWLLRALQRWRSRGQ